ncbi:MAG: hypothetical protein KAJ20_02600 [Candidatus Aenigmarchaeota archaeon]|nr:hypothetical protein [Candidatus Aenigmarchaeota archaeon]
MPEENAEDMIRKERLEKFYKKFFLAIAIISFYAIIKLTFIATKDMVLDVAINCEFELSESEGYVFSRIRNVEDAQDVMTEHTDKNFTFIKFILEPCGDGGGSAYYFNTSAYTYRLCEEGTVQKFVEVCGTRGFTGKMLKSTVEFLDIIL